jgi:hypothetical protein
MTIIKTTTETIKVIIKVISVGGSGVEFGNKSI